MKIMFVSDVHGKSKYLLEIKSIYDIEKPDKIIFLGDMYYGSYSSIDEIDNILLSFSNKYILRGNCDSDIDVLTSPFGFLNFYTFEAFNKKFYCSHGNRYNITNYPEEEFDVMVYGHTHKGMIIKDRNKYFLNPGSISLPRGESVNSYMIIDDKGIYLKDLKQNVINKLLW